MNKVELEAKAGTILESLNDRESSLGFHCMAILKLGFPRCYELASISLQAAREGRVKTSAAQYFNGCVMKEISLKRGTKR